MGSEGYGVASGINNFINTYNQMTAAQDERDYRNKLLKLKEDESQQRTSEFAAQNRLRTLQEKKLAQELEQGPKLTEGQAKTLASLQTLQSGQQMLDTLQKSGYDPTKPQLSKGLLKGIQSVAETYVPKLVPEALKSQERKAFETGGRLVAEGILRPKTGAAITKSESESTQKSYLPQPGDTPQVLEAKAIARAREVQSLQAVAGPGGARQSDLNAGAPIGSQANQIAQKSMLGGGAAQANSPEVMEALKWATANPKDPRSQEIIQIYGGK